MTGILAAVCIAILVVMALSLARAFNAPTVYDRILGVNMFGTKTVLFFDEPILPVYGIGLICVIVGGLVNSVTFTKK